MLFRNVQSLLDRRGQNATLRKIAYGAYDPETGSVTGTPTDYTVKCYFADYDLSEINNDSIVMGDRKAVFPARDTSGDPIPEPSAEDKILSVGDTVVIKAVSKIYNGTTVVCYMCQVRE